MSGVVATLVCGMLISGGLTGLVLSAVPRPHRLADLLSTMDTAGEREGSVAGSISDSVDLVGYREQASQDLFLLGVAPAAHAQRKLIYAIGSGVFFVLLLAVLSRISDGAVPFWSVPLAGVAATLAGFVWPDLELRSDAEDAREEFNYALAAFFGSGSHPHGRQRRHQ